jgi:PAS domain S-box-containing protein
MKNGLRTTATSFPLDMPGEEKRADTVFLSFTPLLPESHTSVEDLKRVIDSFTTVFQHHPTPMWVFDRESLKILAVNDAAVQEYGYDHTEFLNMTIADIQAEGDGVNRLQVPGREQPGDPFPGYSRHRFKNGGTIDVHVTTQEIDWGECRAIFMTAKDISDYFIMEARLGKLNRLYTILQEINHAIIRQRALPEIFKQICCLVVEKGIFDLSWISLVDPDLDGGLRVTACAAESSTMMEKVKIKPGIPGADVGPYFQKAAAVSPIINNNIAHGCSEEIFVGGLCDCDINSYAILPLLVNGEIRGTLNLFSHHAGIIDEQEKDLLLEMAEDVAFAMDQADREHRRQVAEIDLEEKTAELDRYFESNLDMLCIADTDGYFHRLNPEWEKTLGYPMAELEGMRFLDLVHPEDIQPTLDAISSLRDQHEVLNFTNRYRCKDGSYRWIEWRSFPSGDIIYASARDITAHMQAEENLRRSQRQFKAFIELFPGPAFIKDHERRFQYISSEYVDAYHIPTEDWIGHTMEELVQSPYIDQIRMDDEKVLSSGQPYIFENNTDPVKPARGRWLLTTLFPLTDDSGGVGLGGFSIDVTDLKKREKEIQILFELTTALRSHQTREEIIAVVCATVRQALDADSGQIILPDAERKNFIISGVDGHVSTSLGFRFPIGEGMSSWVWKTGQTYVSEDYASDIHHSQRLDEKDLTGPSIFTPLRSEEDLIGVLFVSRLRAPDVLKFNPEEVRMFMAIGEIAGSALRRADLYTDALRRLNHVQALRNIDLAIAGDMDLPLTLDLMLKEIRTELDVDAADILFLDDDSETLKFAAGSGFKTNLIEKESVRLGEGLAGEAALERAMKYSHHLASEPGFLRSDLRLAEGFEVYYAAPMISKGRLLGILEVFHRSTHPTMEEWMDLFNSMAGRAAIAVENTNLISDLQESNKVLRQAYDATILGWSRAMDLRDEETEGHTQRVTEMTLNLSRAMGISEEELVHVRRGALLHDMGKLGVPDRILRKPGPLTEEEWVIMRCHPLYTYDMLSPIEFLRPSLDIPFYHHERWDGTGYPGGLKGEDIPLPARIFAVVDVFDALTSNRPYRPAWSREKTLEHIRQGSGSHFDPAVVELFMKMMDKPTPDPFSLFGG